MEGEYIHMCMCVCVCVEGERERERRGIDNVDGREWYRGKEMKRRMMGEWG